jgi:HAE1 family hydrophobic/amphiphilic exporter-1
MDEPRTPPVPDAPDVPAHDETRAHRLERFLPRFSLTRRVTVLVLLASALVVGAVTTQLIPLGLLPEGIEGSFLSIVAPWQDAPPRETMEKIVLPLEEELATVRGIDRITSRASSGSGRVWLSFKQGTDMDVAYREVRDRVERARLRMPDDVEQVYIRKDDASGIPVVMLGLALDPDLTDPYNLIEYQVIRPLERLDGVASVGIEGLQEKEILIELDRDRTEASGLNIYQLAQELGGDNFSLASGHVTSGGKKLLLRSVARYGSLEELQNRPVAPNIRLKDIGTVAYVAPERRFSVRANSKPAYALSIIKEGQANTIELAGRIQTEVERMQRDPRLAGID